MAFQQEMYDIIVVGGGVVGLSAAYKLQLRNPGLRILVLEKENQLSMHQTGRNSGVIHSGLYYKPGSLKAVNCVKGRRELVQFCETYKVPHDVCGKIVVATDAAELPYLDKIYGIGQQNEIEGLTKINADQIRELEPNCVGIAGLHVACTGIIDYPALVYKLAELLTGLQPESKVLTGQEVQTLVHHEDSTEVITGKGRFSARHMVFCGGLFSDRLAMADEVQPDARIVGFRGDYYDLTPEAQHKVRNLIYPVPNPAFPFLGVHFTRMIHGGVECGPNAVFTFKREGYGKTDFDLRDTWEALTFSGTWRLFAQHWRFGLDEYRRAFSKRLFLKQIQRMVPSITMEDIIPGRSGVRAMALGPDGAMIDDFKIEYSGRSIHILNAPSPAATAGLAIGEQVSEMAEERFGLKV
ncbi:MAG: L-2-hydroxyglutarate oxidase [Bacteroidia bacterium]|jgi:L-2-hydroxyglutarate oxidase|nr:L-2-hydroxyglutarate oxidase [Bacteroidia bacterium]